MNLLMQVIIYLAGILYCIYGIGIIFQNIIFKVLIFSRLRKNFYELWEELGSPKFWALIENVEVINKLHDYPYLYDEIKGSDELLVYMVNVTVKIDSLMHKMTYPMLIVTILGLIALKFVS
jgi:hypothetical protein